MKDDMPIAYEDRISPFQQFGSKLYADQEPLSGRMLSVLADYSKSIQTPLKHVAKPDNIELEEMTTPPHQLALLELLITIKKPKSLLEIGTFVGMSAISFAQMLGSTGRVTTIEAHEPFANMAARNFENAGLVNRITLIRESAGTALDKLNEKFDVIFIDGGKQDYLEFAIKSLSLVEPEGLIVIDDIFFHGDALNAEPNTEKGKGCKNTLEYFEKYDRCKKMIIPSWNGVLVLYAFNSR